MKIVLIEDSPTQAEHIAGLVEEAIGSPPTIFYSLASFRSFLETNEAPDVVISDMTLPDSDGLDTVRGVREAVPDTPMIVITSTHHEDEGPPIFMAGADDYLLKSSLSAAVVKKSIDLAQARGWRKQFIRLQAADRFCPPPGRTGGKILLFMILGWLVVGILTAVLLWR